MDSLDLVVLSVAGAFLILQLLMMMTTIIPRATFVHKQYARVFIRPFPGVASKTSRPSLASLKKLCDAGHVGNALAHMRCVYGSEFTLDTYQCLLELCIEMKDLASGGAIHSLLQKNRLETNCLLGRYLISLYSLCGHFSKACGVFFSLTHPDVFTWSAIISACVRHGQGGRAIELYHTMQNNDMQPDSHIFVSVLSACACLSALAQGMLIHLQVMESGFDMNVYVGNALIDMYAKCEKNEEAHAIFNRQKRRDIITWNAIIAAYAQSSQAEFALKLYQEMHNEGNMADAVTFVSMLKACSQLVALHVGQVIHFWIVDKGFESNEFLESVLIDMYAKCGCLGDACTVFCTSAKYDVVTWNTMLAAYAYSDCSEHEFEALNVFHQMLYQCCTFPTAVTTLSILKACSNSAPLTQGKHIHVFIIENGFLSNRSVYNALLSMYAGYGSLDDLCKVFNNANGKDVISWNVMIAGHADNGSMDEALHLFERMQHNGTKPDIVTWNTAVAGCARHGRVEEAFELFKKMEKFGQKPDNITFVSILKSCASSGWLEQGRHMHARAVASGFGSDIFVINTLIDMYAKCGSLKTAREVFDRACKKSLVNAMIAGYAQHGCHLEAHRLLQKMMQGGSKPNVVTWNTMIAGLVQYGHVKEALELFNKMHLLGMDANGGTILNLVKGCTIIGALDLGMIIHTIIIANGFDSVVEINNSLVDMYFKCGSLQQSCTVFRTMAFRSTATWNTMIAAYARLGDARLGLLYFKKMLREGMRPDAVTFTSLLSAFSHSGILDEGCQWFKAMTSVDRSTPSHDHYNSIVDVLGRAGSLDKAEEVLKTMPFYSDFVGWMALLNNCKTYGNWELGRQCFSNIINCNNSHGAGYVLMSNIYADADLFDVAKKVEALRKFSVAWKKAGTAFMEINFKLYEFTVQTKSNPSSLQAKLNRLNTHWRASGWVPTLESVIQQ